jgi:hypothetical protein
MPVAPPRVDEVGGSQGTTGTTRTTTNERDGGGSSGTGGEGMTEGWTQVVKGGFTDPGNSHAPAWAEFKDHLYVSTMANEMGSMFSGSEKMGADIWRTADGIVWEQVGTTGLGNPANNLFQLVVFRDQLYAISANFDHGIEIWVTSDGTQFTQIENGGFGDKANNWSYPYVFRDRLILGVSNSETGAEIWVSEDGETFRQVVDGGMGDSGVTGFSGYSDLDDPHPVLIFRDNLYIGASNPESGGEIWRTPDGLAWERVADGGPTRSTSVFLNPDIVYEDQLYAFGIAGGTLGNLPGFDLFRTTDGVNWEQVVEDGFGVGQERNVSGHLQEFKGRLYLATNNADPRLLVPGTLSERHSPYGFQLWVSDDGKNWTQVGEDGLGAENSFMAGMIGLDEKAYIAAFDYHEGSRFLESVDGEAWKVIFQEPDPGDFQEGSGPLGFLGHFLWIRNDLENGVQIWRSDEVMVAESTTTAEGDTESGGGSDTTASGTGTGSNGGGTASGDETGGGGGGFEGEGSRGEGGGLSGGWIALIVALAVVAMVAIVTVAFLLGRMGRGPHTASPGPSGGADSAMTRDQAAVQAAAVSTSYEATEDPVASQVSSQSVPGTPAFCSDCGTSLAQGASYCPGCGRQL